MEVLEFVDEGLGHSSYLVDLGNGSATVIDPPRFPAEHERTAADRGLVIDWTIDTHSHADYVTGSPGISVRHGATFIAPAASRLVTSHRPVVDDERIELCPGVELVALATPGHTPDHFAFLLAHNGAPTALFSGGSLMVGTVGRTDLCGPELADPLAHQMFRALRRFDTFPDEVVVYPTHGAGSFCSAPGSPNRTTTIGAERVANNLFRMVDETRFVHDLLGGFGTFPSYFRRLPELNRLGPTRYDTVPFLTGMTADDVADAVASGAVIVDARPIHRYATGHVPGSISNTLRPVFASWTGWLVDPTRPIVFVLDDGQPHEEAVRQCLDIGHERFAGVLTGGINAWRDAGKPLRTIDIVDFHHLRDHVIDVRQANEFANGHVPGAINIELGATPTAQIGTTPATVMCGHGERAMTAASILTTHGYEVNVLDGGPDTWSAETRRPLQVGA